MEYKFIEEIVDKKDLLKSEVQNPFLLENNQTQIENIINFLRSEKSLLLVSGFLGTGKSAIVKHCLSFCTSETIILRYNCFETTALDDILLELFDDFKQLTMRGTIGHPKTKSDNFVQKINSYFAEIDKPVVLVLNSFEEVLKDNKQEILDFVLHLAQSPQIKVILISRVFVQGSFALVTADKVTILALQEPIFEKYLRAEGFKQIGPVSQELYKQSRGYFLYTTLSIEVMKQKNYSLGDFLAAQGKSLLSFSDFILREALSLVDPVSGHLFRFLTIIRHPVPTKLLQAWGLYDKEKVDFFIEKKIISAQGEQIYLEDYFKDIFENSIPENIAVKLHKSCVELYESQLPLKPFERNLLISRKTMRSEIEYHSMFIPKKPMLEQKQAVVEQQAQVETKPVENKVENLSFIFETEESGDILEKIAGSITDYITISDERVKEREEIKALSMSDLVNRAKQQEEAYNFQNAAEIYLRALALENEDDYYAFLPTLLTKIAAAYGKLSNWFDSLKYYERAKEFYTSAGDAKKVNEMKWEIANIYYITFKRDKAKELLEEIIKTASGGIKIKSYLILADIAGGDTKLARNCYEQALSNTTEDKNILAELYFKYALILDEQNHPEQAVQYYKKCAELGQSEWLAPSYSNTAIIFEETGNSQLAIKYLLESLRIDETARNFNGIYISSMKLGDLYSLKDGEKAHEYYKKAKAAALELNEPAYIEMADQRVNEKW